MNELSNQEAELAMNANDISRTPTNARCPFVHEKAKYFSVAFEGGLIFMASPAIFLAATGRLMPPPRL